MIIDRQQWMKINTSERQRLSSEPTSNISSYGYNSDTTYMIVEPIDDKSGKFNTTSTAEPIEEEIVSKTKTRYRKPVQLYSPKITITKPAKKRKAKQIAKKVIFGKLVWGIHIPLKLMQYQNMQYLADTSVDVHT